MFLRTFVRFACTYVQNCLYIRMYVRTYLRMYVRIICIICMYYTQDTCLPTMHVRARMRIILFFRFPWKLMEVCNNQFSLHSRDSPSYRSIAKQHQPCFHHRHRVAFLLHEISLTCGRTLLLSYLFRLRSLCVIVG